MEVFAQVLDDKLDKFCVLSEIGSLCECLCLVLDDELHGFWASVCGDSDVSRLSPDFSDLGNLLGDRRLPL